MTRKRSPEREEFLKDTLITAVEGGINYWGAVADYDPDAGTVTVYEKEYLDTPDEKAFPVTMDTMARGWGQYVKRVGKAPTGYARQALLANRTNGDDGDFDADVADVVLQLGIFGEVVYA
jgi:hypothetical protein